MLGLGTLYKIIIAPYAGFTAESMINFQSATWAAYDVIKNASPNCHTLHWDFGLVEEYGRNIMDCWSFLAPIFRQGDIPYAD